MSMKLGLFIRGGRPISFISFTMVQPYAVVTQVLPGVGRMGNAQQRLAGMAESAGTLVTFLLRRLVSYHQHSSRIKISGSIWMITETAKRMVNIYGAVRQ
jgi:hypothetical protein